MFGLATALQPVRIGAMSVTGVLLVALLSSFATIGGAPASSDLCGRTITKDLELNHDLSCPGNGLIVGANGITIDLNGHTISGSGTGLATVGISVSGKSGVEIEGPGTISKLTAGILISGSTDISVESVRVSENGFAGLAPLRGGNSGVQSTNVELEDNRVDVNSVGIVLAGTSTGNSIEENKIRGNGVGIRFWGTLAGNSVEENKITSNGCGVQGPTAGNEFEDNKLKGNGQNFC